MSQRLGASKGAARRGLVGGATALLVFGVLLVFVGLIAKTAGVTEDPNQAFGAVMTGLLPRWAGVIAILLVLTTVMSTADTEMFLTGGLLSRELARLRGAQTARSAAAATTIVNARVSIVLCSLVAIVLALLVRGGQLYVELSADREA